MFTEQIDQELNDWEIIRTAEAAEADDGAPAKAQAADDKLNIILGKVHDETTAEMVEQTLKTAKLNYLSVEKLEKELQRQYEIYIDKYRNLDYLENQLEQVHRHEEERMQEHGPAAGQLQGRTARSPPPLQSPSGHHPGRALKKTKNIIVF